MPTLRRAVYSRIIRVGPSALYSHAQVKCAELLLDAGAHPTAFDNAGRTPEVLAAECGQEAARATIAARAKRMEVAWEEPKRELISARAMAEREEASLSGPPKPDPRSVHSALFGISRHAALNQPSQLR